MMQGHTQLSTADDREFDDDDSEDDDDRLDDLDLDFDDPEVRQDARLSQAGTGLMGSPPPKHWSDTDLVGMGGGGGGGTAGTTAASGTPSKHRPRRAAGFASGRCAQLQRRFGGNHRSILLFSATSFSFMGICVQLAASTGIPAAQLVFMRAIFQGLLTVGGLWASGIQPTLWLGAPHMRKWVIARGAFGGVGFMLYFTMMANLPLGDAIALMSLAPVTTALFARVLLKEQTSKVTVVAVAVAATGGILVARPTFLFPLANATANAAAATTAANSSVLKYANSTRASDLTAGSSSSSSNHDDDFDGVPGHYSDATVGYVAAVFSTVTSAAVSVLIRRARTAHTLQLLFSWASSAAVISLFTCLVVPSQNMVSPTAQGWGYVFALSIIGAWAHFLMNHSARHVPASHASIIRTTDVVMSYVLEIVVVGVVPGGVTVFGALLILSAVFATAFGKRALERQGGAKSVLDAAAILRTDRLPMRAEMGLRMAGGDSTVGGGAGLVSTGGKTGAKTGGNTAGMAVDTGGGENNGKLKPSLYLREDGGTRAAAVGAAILVAGRGDGDGDVNGSSNGHGNGIDDGGDAARRRASTAEELDQSLAEFSEGMVVAGAGEAGIGGGTKRNQGGVNTVNTVNTVGTEVGGWGGDGDGDGDGVGDGGDIGVRGGAKNGSAIRRWCPHRAEMIVVSIRADTDEDADVGARGASVDTDGDAASGGAGRGEQHTQQALERGGVVDDMEEAGGGGGGGVSGSSGPRGYAPVAT
jgi:drug/metabolite transporter (DMT)-like permease